MLRFKQHTMSITTQIPNQQVHLLRNKEAELQAPVTITNVNDYIRLMKRYREYLALFNELGLAYAKAHYYECHLETTLDDLCIQLYIDVRTNEVVFNNKCTLFTHFTDEYLNLEPEVLRGISHSREYFNLTSNFTTPITISEAVMDQLPLHVFIRDDLFFADDVLVELEDIRKEKLRGLLSDL